MRCRYGEVIQIRTGSLPWNLYTVEAAKLIYGLTRDMPTTEVLKTAKWDSLHFMYKVKLATLAYKIFHDCTPPSMGHILTKKSSSIHHLRTTNTVTVPRFNTYFMKIK